MNRRIYVSTRVFQSRRLDEILEQAKRYGIKNLELSSGIQITPHLEDLLDNLPPDMSFLVHNYFPPENTGLVINLASGNTDIRKQSIEFCKKAIDLCVEVKSVYYTVHSGFCVDPVESQLGQDQTGLARIDRHQAIEYFYESLEEILSYAGAQRIIFCIENNVIESQNLIDGKNQTDLMTSIDDFRHLMNQPRLNPIKFLIDLGHLNIAALSEGFDKEEFLDLVKPRTTIFHISDNNGLLDQHLSPHFDSWFMSRLCNFDHTLFALEAYGIPVEQIRENVQMLERAISR